MRRHYASEMLVFCLLKLSSDEISLYQEKKNPGLIEAL